MNARSIFDMELTIEQRHWASRAKQGVPPSELRRMLVNQGGLCGISGVALLFDRTERTPIKDGRGCHPLSPAIDHIDPGFSGGGFQIVCYALNDLKGHLPVECFLALKNTDAWLDLMKAWRAQAESDSSDREAFRRLLRPNAG